MPPSRPLTIFPSELLHEFASHIESTGDLLHLALTCSLLSKIVLPDHIRYRTISCEINDMNLWKHLIAYPGRTRNIRVLDITKCVDQFQDDELGRWLVGQESRWQWTLKDCKKVYSHFEKALSLMVQLSALRLHRPSLWPSPTGAWDVPGLHIWEHMRSIGVLKHLDVIVERRMDLDRPPSGQSQCYAKLSDMTSLTLTIPSTVSYNTMEDVPNFASSPVLDPLINSLGMQQLYLDCAYHVNLAPLFNATFPKLYRLSAKSRDTFTPAFHELAAIFLSNHPMLEILHWDVTAQETPLDRLRFGSLPFLRRLSGDTESIIRILSSPTSILRPTEVITNVALGDGFWEAMKYIDRSTLRELEVTSFESLQDIARLADEVPALTHLSIELGRLESMRKWCNLQHLLSKWLKVLPGFKSLQRLHVTTLFSDILYPTAETLVPLLSQQLPLLNMMIHRDNFRGKDTTVTQIRTEEGVSWNVEHRRLSTAELHEIDY